jgi:nicotinamide phosphoribosyltransferase
MYIINTHPDFPWITEFLESVTSSEVWYPMAIANQAYYYRQIVNKWYNKTGCDDNARKSAISEFGFRGGKSSDAAIKASSAFLTSFNKTATIPAIKYMHDYYGDPVKEIGGGMISTEHSVMCSNYAVDVEELKGKAICVKPGEKTWDLKVGDIYYMEGENTFNMVVPFNTDEDYN